VGGHVGDRVLGKIEEEKDEKESLKSSLSSAKVQDRVTIPWTNRLLSVATCYGNMHFTHKSLIGKGKFTLWVWMVEGGGTRDVTQGGDDMMVPLWKGLYLIDYEVMATFDEMYLRLLLVNNTDSDLDINEVKSKVVSQVHRGLKQDRHAFTLTNTKYKEDCEEYKATMGQTMSFKMVGLQLERNMLKGWLAKVSFYNPLMDLFYKVWGMD